MSFDLYGLNPKNGIPKPDEPDWVTCSQNDKDAFIAWRENAETDETKGTYLKIAHPEWFSIWKLIIEKHHELLTDKEQDLIFFNDEQIINQEKTTKIEKIITDLIENHKIDDDLIKSFKSFAEFCKYSGGFEKG